VVGQRAVHASRSDRSAFAKSELFEYGEQRGRTERPLVQQDHVRKAGSELGVSTYIIVISYLFPHRASDVKVILVPNQKKP